MQPYDVTFRVLFQKERSLRFFASSEEEACRESLTFLHRIGQLSDEELGWVCEVKADLVA